MKKILFSILFMILLLVSMVLIPKNVFAIGLVPKDGIRWIF